MQGSRIDYIDALSGLASIRTVLIHSLANFFVMQSMTPYFLELPNWARVMDLILRHSVPIFVFAAGFRYQMSVEKHPNRGYASYVSLRVKRMAIPFLFWTAFYYVFCGMFEPSLMTWNPIFSGWPFPSVRQIAGMLTGDGNPAYQFWFLPMLFLVNLIYPAVAALPFRRFTPTVLGISFYVLSWYLDLQHPADYLKYILFYDLGVLACRHRSDDRLTKWMWFVFGMSLSSTLIISLIKFQTRSPVRMVQADTALALTVLGLFVSIFYFWSPRIPRFLVNMGRLTWPIYILHDPLILRNFGLLLVFKLSLTAPVFFPVAGILSLIVSYLIYRLIVRLKLQKILF